MPIVNYNVTEEGEEIVKSERMVTLMVPNTKLFFFFTVDYDAYVSQKLPLINLVDSDPIVSTSIFLWRMISNFNKALVVENEPYFYYME